MVQGKALKWDFFSNVKRNSIRLNSLYFQDIWGRKRSIKYLSSMQYPQLCKTVVAEIYSVNLCLAIPTNLPPETPSNHLAVTFSA